MKRANYFDGRFNGTIKQREKLRLVPGASVASSASFANIFLTLVDS